MNNLKATGARQSPEVRRYAIVPRWRVLPWAFLFLTAGVLAQTTPGVAAPASGPPAQLPALSKLSDAHSIARVRLFMAIPFMETAVPLTPEQLVRTGCSFETARPAATARLVTLIQRAHLVPTQPSNRELRRLVILDFKDGQEMRIAFDISYPKDEVLFGNIDGVPFTADKKFGGELFEWARSLSEQSACSPHIENYK